MKILCLLGQFGARVIVTCSHVLCLDIRFLNLVLDVLTLPFGSRLFLELLLKGRQVVRFVGESVGYFVDGLG